MIKLFKHKKNGHLLFVIFDISFIDDKDEKHYQGLFSDYRPTHTTIKNLKVNYERVINPFGVYERQLQFIKNSVFKKI